LEPFEPKCPKNICVRCGHPVVQYTVYSENLAVRVRRNAENFRLGTWARIIHVFNITNSVMPLGTLIHLVVNPLNSMCTIGMEIIFSFPVLTVARRKWQSSGILRRVVS
jgi:hypothetical protein